MCVCVAVVVVVVVVVVDRINIALFSLSSRLSALLSHVILSDRRFFWRVLYIH